jgi:hypothetical protein
MNFPKVTNNKELPRVLRAFYGKLNESVTERTPGDASSERQANVRYMKRALQAYAERNERIRLQWVEPEISEGQVEKRTLRRNDAVLEFRYGVWYRQDNSVI